MAIPEIWRDVDSFLTFLLKKDPQQLEIAKIVKMWESCKLDIKNAGVNNIPKK